LDAEKMGQELDALLEEKASIAAQKSKNEGYLKDKSNEFLILARLTSTDFTLTDRFEKTLTYFEQSVRANRNEENIFAYAYFLNEHNQFLKALSLYEEALEIYKRLAQTNPERYEPYVAMTQNNLGLMYRRP
jgi:nephrocystin-3